MAHTRQSRPDSSLGFGVKVDKTFKVFPSSLGNGTSGSEAGSYLRLIDLMYHSTLGLRLIKKKRRGTSGVSTAAVGPVARTKRFDHPLFLIAYPYTAQFMGAWRAKGS